MAKVTLESVYRQIEEQRETLIRLINLSVKSHVITKQLSETCMKLAILNELLGGFLADLKAVQLEAEARAYAIAKEAGATDTGAGSTTRLSTNKQRLAYDRADTKHSDIWKVIEMAKTHIRVETDERKGN